MCMKKLHKEHCDSSDELIIILFCRTGVSNYVQIAILKIMRFTKTDVIKCT